MAAELVNILYSLIDRMYIDHIAGLGTAALSGIGLCLPIITIISGFANLVATGGASLCTIARGQKKIEKAQKLQNTAFSMLLLIGAIVVYFYAYTKTICKSCARAGSKLIQLICRQKPPKT